MHITSTVLNYYILYGDIRNQRKDPRRSSGHLTIFGNIFFPSNEGMCQECNKIIFYLWFMLYIIHSKC